MSDEPPRTRRPHPIRLAIFMLIGPDLAWRWVRSREGADRTLITKPIIEPCSSLSAGDQLSAEHSVSSCESVNAIELPCRVKRSDFSQSPARMTV